MERVGERGRETERESRKYRSLPTLCHPQGQGRQRCRERRTGLHCRMPSLHAALLSDIVDYSPVYYQDISLYLSLSLSLYIYIYIYIYIHIHIHTYVYINNYIYIYIYIERERERERERNVFLPAGLKPATMAPKPHDMPCDPLWCDVCVARYHVCMSCLRCFDVWLSLRLHVRTICDV